MTKIQKTFKKLLKIPNILYNLLKNITFQILWTKKGTKTLLFEQEQKGLKLISLSLVFGTLFDNKEHLWTKREQLYFSRFLDFCEKKDIF